MDVATDSTHHADTTGDANKPTYFRHSRRERWGVAVLLWERDGKRAYRFSDGKERIFKEQFCDLIVPVEDDIELSTEERRALRSGSGSTTTGRTKSGKIAVDIEDQITMLHALYPEGFRGTAWVHRYRTEPGKRRAKRFRDPVIEKAKEAFAPEQVAKRVDAENWEELFKQYTKMLSMTDLVPAKQVRELSTLTVNETNGRALAEYLTEENPGAAFDTWMNILRRAELSGNLWPIATAPLAFARPKKLVCVRANVFDRQGAALIPGFSGSKIPSATDYGRYMTITERVRDKLVDHKQEPTDLLDVADFIWETMRPAARDEINRLRAERLDL